MVATAADWSNFYLASAAGAAALTALLFVAVSMRPAEIRAAPASLGRARGAFYALASVMIVSLISLAPLSAVPLSAIQAATCLFAIGIAAPLVAAVVRAKQLRRNALRIGAYYLGLTVISAAAIARGAGLSSGVTQPVIAAAAMLLLVIGLNNAWVLVLTVEGRIEA